MKCHTKRGFGVSSYLVGDKRDINPSSPVGSSFWFFSRKYTRYESTGSDLGDIIRVNAL